MKSALLIGFAFASIAGTAFAQPAPAAGAQPTPDMKALHEAVLKACGADQEKFCHGKEGKEGHDCMAAALPKAAPVCQAAIAKMSQATAQAPAH